MLIIEVIGYVVYGKSLTFFCKSKTITKLNVYLNKKSIGRIWLREED